MDLDPSLGVKDRKLYLWENVEYQSGELSLVEWNEGEHGLVAWMQDLAVR
mgnify:CR=1 FL=1